MINNAVLTVTSQLYVTSGSITNTARLDGPGSFVVQGVFTMFGGTIAERGLVSVQQNGMMFIHSGGVAKTIRGRYFSVENGGVLQFSGSTDREVTLLMGPRFTVQPGGSILFSTTAATALIDGSISNWGRRPSIDNYGVISATSRNTITRVQVRSPFAPAPCRHV